MKLSEGDFNNCNSAVVCLQGVGLKQLFLEEQRQGDFARLPTGIKFASDLQVDVGCWPITRFHSNMIRIYTNINELKNPIPPV